jgi:hypothetical protein
VSLDLTVRLEPQARHLDEAFREGVADGLNGRRSANLRQAQGLWDDIREGYGLARCHPTLLTLPSGNVKLRKSKVPTWGLNLRQHVQRINRQLVVNVCPNAGDCAAVCVMNEGNGRYDKVQIARRARTAFLTLQPQAFSYLLGYDLGRVERDKLDRWLFRPNVGSDVAWERLLPSMLDGSMLPAMTAYGYSKRPEVLATDGWISTAYRVAYSWNETSDAEAVSAFVLRGGSVAVVTDRTRRQPAAEFVQLDSERFSFIWQDIADADKTDEWIFRRGVIGDLSAKGKARKLIGKSGFVITREAA